MKNKFKSFLHLVNAIKKRKKKNEIQMHLEMPQEN